MNDSVLCTNEVPLAALEISNAKLQLRLQFAGFFIRINKSDVWDGVALCSFIRLKMEWCSFTNSIFVFPDATASFCISFCHIEMGEGGGGQKGEGRGMFPIDLRLLSAKCACCNTNQCYLKAHVILNHSNSCFRFQKRWIFFLPSPPLPPSSSPPPPPKFVRFVMFLLGRLRTEGCFLLIPPVEKESSFLHTVSHLFI